MSIRFLTDYPALFIADKKILVIADLHLGLEHELYKNGIVIHPQGEKFKKQIEKLSELTGAKILVILGDIKHKVPGISLREEREVPKMLNELVKKIKIILCIGNHDTELEKIVLKEMKIYSSRGFKIGKYGFFHGHAWPSKKLIDCDYLFMGHIHPIIEFRDKLGYRMIEQVWIKGKLNEKLIKEKYKTKKNGKLEIIILPTFNKLLGGIALNMKTKEELIGPILANKFLDLDKSKVYLLDGTFLGNLERLKI